jgi:hypothetical protein
MPRDREEILRRMEDRVSTVSGWLAARRAADERRLERLRAVADSLRRDIEKEIARSAHDELARARASIDGTNTGAGAPPPPAALGREELDELMRHLQLTATLLPRLSNLDDPGWRPAHDEYERSWAEVRRAYEDRRGAAP